MQSQNVTRNTIPLDALEGIGFLPNAEDVLTPKQKDMFADFQDTFEQISGEAIKTETEKKPAEEKPVATTEVAEVTPDPAKKLQKPVASQVEELANDITKAVTEQPAADAEIELEQKKAEDKNEIKSKTGLVRYLKNKIESGTFQPYTDFDDTKHKLTEYLFAMTDDQLQELTDKNTEIREQKVRDDYQEEFYSSLPGHLSVVARAIVEGTMDPEVAYVALGRVEQARRLDPKDENDQVGIVQSYLQAKQFGTAEQISTQVEEWKESNLLDKKAAQFKPLLDRMQEEQVTYYAQQAETSKQKQQEAAQWYAQSVEQALKDGDLNGMKIGRKKQKELYDDMLLNIKPSVRNGQPLNALWQGIERISLVEPDFKLLTEVNYLVNYPDEYREMLKQQGRNEQQGKITKELKTIQGSVGDRGQEIAETPKRRTGIVKQTNPFDAATK